MERHYKDVEAADDVIYFVGPEVERTKMFGEPTLFKVGERPLAEILDYVKMGSEKIGKPINHIYFTANHSFLDIEDWNVVHSLLAAGFYVTVDGFIYDINGHTFPDNDHLIIIMGLPIANAENRVNTYLKVDTDTLWTDGSNPGVWVTPLRNMIKYQDSVNFTPWEDYKVDIILK